ncbi:MAG: hypothetical protein ACYC2G_16120, partial [Gemmatimonadaceae bacterium]
WWRAIAPGPPGRADVRLHVAGREGASGRLCVVWSGRSHVRSASWRDGALHVTLDDGEHHVHTPLDERWRIGLHVGGARSTIHLAGARPRVPRPAAPPAGPPAIPPAWSLATPFRAELGEADYRRSELTWREAGEPRATVEVSAADAALVVNVAVVRDAPSFAPPDAVNEMDNERAEVNADGVQLHVLLPGLATPAEPTPVAGWLVAPSDDGGLRVIPLDARAGGIAIDGRWSRTADGYSIRLVIPARALTISVSGPVDVGVGIVVNESAPGRERRRGQLVLGGARDEYVYLRGDRHDAARCLPFELPDA